MARSLLFAAMAQLGMAGAWAVDPEADREPGFDHVRLSVANVVLGIIDYSRWPQPERPALLCVTLGGAHAAALFQALPEHGLARRLAIRAVVRNKPLPAECDVAVYEGWEAAALRQALMAQAARPVMSVGFGGEFCSDGGMICLGQDTAEGSFEVNLDAISRSGLRVNPRVLQLARPKGRPA
ncbi:MAG: YfiR family protein [Burkholderiales bacterium]|nr:YfiR family protein [Burkholderiales bacterium]